MTASTTTLDFGQVVLIPFPFTDQTAVKRRPAVVVSSKDYALQRRDVVLMAVTSQLRSSGVFGETWVRDWRAVGLLKPSAVKPVIATFEQTLVVRVLGRLSAQDEQELRSALGLILG